MGEEKSSGSSTKSFLAGTFAGVVQVLVGQPFDTVKVRLQSQPMPAPGQSPLYASTMDCVKKTLAKEGPGAFYKGTLPPLVGIGACVAIQFGTVHQTKNYLKTFNAPGQNLTWTQHAVAGAVAGLANSVLAGPIEHIRTRLQVQTGPDGYKGAGDAVKRIFQQHGLKGIYKGQVPTIVREIFGYAGYFLAYEYAVHSMLKEGESVKDLNPLVVMMCGSIGGLGMWVPFFPLDSLKSRIQTDKFGSEARYKNMIDCAKKSIREEGVRGLYRGFWPCLLRAAIVNASTFLAFESAMNALGRD